MITYPVSPQSRWSVLQLSTGQIVARNKPWPTIDRMAIPGLDPDYVYLEQVTDTRPDYDYRLFSLQAVEVIDPAQQEIRTTWQTTLLDINDVQTNLANVEIAELEKQIPENQFRKMVILGLSTLFRQVANQELTAREIRLKRRILTKGRAAWVNDQRLADLRAAVATGNSPDIDAGWSEIEEDEN